MNMCHTHLRINLKLIVAVISIAIAGILSCCNNSSKKPKSNNFVSHVNDTIKLNLYDVSLGDSLSTVKEKFKEMKLVPLDSLSSYLPIENNHKIVYENLGISIYTTDTIFIANHEGWQHVDSNGFYKNFPLKNTKHRAQLIFFIKDDKVLQSEVLIYSPLMEIDGVELSHDGFIKSISSLYENKYSNPDSIMLYNRKSRYAAVYSIDTDSIIKERIYKNVKESDILNEYPPSISISSIWSWKNANIIAEWDFQPYKGGQIWFWIACSMVRIIYTDLSAVELETKKREEQIRRHEQDSIMRINEIDKKNSELLLHQII